MAAIRMAYLGGGSTRAVGTVASFIHQGDDFAGSEIVLIDLPGSRLDLVKTLAEKMAKARSRPDGKVINPARPETKLSVPLLAWILTGPPICGLPFSSFRLISFNSARSPAPEARFSPAMIARTIPSAVTRDVAPRPE